MNDIANVPGSIVLLVSCVLMVVGAAGVVYGRIKRWSGGVMEIYLIALIGGILLTIELKIT